jgi:hypothetical protein
MFSISLQRADHVRRYSIRSAQAAGWEVRLEEDDTLTRHVRYHDWHRVERALAIVRLEIADLTAQGWEVRARSS